MNTGTRRLILHIVVGLLAFLIGVATTWAWGAFDPFRSSSGTRYYKYKRCRSYARPQSYGNLEPGLAAEPIFLVGPNGARLKGDLREPPPPLPPSPGR